MPKPSTGSGSGVHRQKLWRARQDDYAALVYDCIKTYEQDDAEPKHLADLFPEQRAFVESPAKRKAALCSRRAGKTWGVGAWLLDGAGKAPNGISVYIALTRNNARGILWKTLQEMDRKLSLGLKFREIDGQLMVQADNGHMIWLVGCKDASQAEKFRGYQFSRVAIDEAGSFPSWVEYLIEDVLVPTLLDNDGEIALVGTPGLTPAGYFFDATTGTDANKSWSTFTWTVVNNPHIPHAEKWLTELRERKGWAEDHPTFRREWRGVWVRDDEARVYPFDAAMNTYRGDAGETARRVLAVDLGFDDCTAFVVAANVPGQPVKYIERAWRASGMTPSQTAARIDQLRHEIRFDRIVIDEGALGKSIAEDFRRVFGIPCVRAEKKQKLAAVHLLRGDLLAGMVKLNAHECRQLVEEWMLLPWNEDRDDHHEGFVDDCSDAALYAYRALNAYYEPVLDGPPPGSPDWYDQEAKQHKADTVERIGRADDPWWKRAGRRRR